MLDKIDHQVKLLKCKRKMLRRPTTTKKCSRVLANVLGFEFLKHPSYSPDWYWTVDKNLYYGPKSFPEDLGKAVIYAV